jgi:hypothetical protein
MAKPVKVRMNVSIASETWAYQPGQVIALEPKQARQWVEVGHATPVDPATPVTPPDLLGDLRADEVLRHTCTHCSRRARFVFQNKPFCERCYRAELG